MRYILKFKHNQSSLPTTFPCVISLFRISILKKWTLVKHYVYSSFNKFYTMFIQWTGFWRRITEMSWRWRLVYSSWCKCCICALAIICNLFLMFQDSSVVFRALLVFAVMLLSLRVCRSYTRDWLPCVRMR